MGKVIVYRCDECINGANNKGVVYGYVSEAREDFDCQHKLRKQWQIEDQEGNITWEDIIDACECKYCLDDTRVQTTKDIGENYNYSCREHKRRAELVWVLKSYIIECVDSGFGLNAQQLREHIKEQINGLDKETNQ